MDETQARITFGLLTVASAGSGDYLATTPLLAAAQEALPAACSMAGPARCTRTRPIRPIAVERSPQTGRFQTFFWPGFLLFACLGLLPAAAIYLILRGTPTLLRPLEQRTGRRSGWLVAGASGVATITWIVVQVAMLQGIHALHGVYLLVGSGIVVLALAPSARRWSRLARG
jgi:hypothetical protein